MFDILDLKLYMLLLGCRPTGRFTEQHDILFAIGENPKSLVPQILNFWPEAKGVIHLDAWREVTTVDSFAITIVEKVGPVVEKSHKLYFINLGGYKQREFDEFHYKMLVVASGKDAAIAQAKQTAFYKHTGFVGAPSHIDDKYGVDVDDVFEMKDILHPTLKKRYSVIIQPSLSTKEDDIHLGYFKLDRL